MRKIENLYGGEQNNSIQFLRGSEWKYIPKHLKYVLLGEKPFKLTIISSPYLFWKNKNF